LVRTGKKRKVKSLSYRIIPPLIEPLVIPRADHSISRDQIDPDALKVLYRLRKFNHVAYLVGGSVRDLLLNRKPKDFDVGTSAHPHEVKKLFRNCWIIGRRFRLAHIKFGQKTIEVATFRRQVPPENQTQEPDKPSGRPISRDNTFGTSEEDAFRRDFTINGLFYDIATFSVIDYVGGLADLRNGLIRSIGDPNDRFVEDPVRMLRAVSFAARLGFRLDPLVRRAIRQHRSEIANASPARMIEELYKILRSGVSAQTYRSLLRTGLLTYIAPEIEQAASPDFWKSLKALDSYRTRFTAIPQNLTNAVLLGSLVTPIQLIDLSPRRTREKKEKGPRVTLGQLPIARRDVERLRQLLTLQTRLINPRLPPRAQEAIMHRGAFGDAMTWLEIHSTDSDALNRWQTLIANSKIDHRKNNQQRRRPRRRGGRKSKPVRS